MSVYIKSMEMPKSCSDCPLMEYDIENGCFCYLTNQYASRTRPDDCPLVFVPPHGRLIDADIAYNQFLNLMDIQGAINPCQLGTILVDAPTIIESE